MNKKLAIILLIVFLLIIFTVVPAAHPGRTDENGGHYSYEDGEYHYHHGYPAHQHENGECPYDFKNNERTHSGTNSSSDISRDYNSKAKDSSSYNEEKDRKVKKNKTINIIIIAILLAPEVFGLVNNFFLFVSRRKEQGLFRIKERSSENYHKIISKANSKTKHKCEISPTAILLVYLLALGIIGVMVTFHKNGSLDKSIPMVAMMLFFPFLPPAIISHYFLNCDIYDLWSDHKSVLSIYYAIFATINVVASLIYFS